MNTARLFNYREDSPYLLPSREINQELYNGNQTYSNERTYIRYNSHDDLIGVTEGSYQEEYSDYVYDAHGNGLSGTTTDIKMEIRGLIKKNKPVNLPIGSNQSLI
jgi:hypothetical protein